MECLFVATGVTAGDLVDGVSRSGSHVTTETLLLDSSDKSVRRIRTTSPVG